MDLTKYYADIIAKYPAYVTKRELCEICHICPKTAYNLEQQGEIPYTIEQNHLIRSHKIKLTDILAYPDVMDIGQMCEALGVSTKTGYKLLKDGKIEYLKIGRAYRIPKAHILRYLKITCSTFAE